MLSLVAPYEPAGDQPHAIAKLTEGLLAGAKHQVVLGVTGSGIYGKSSKGDFQVLSGSCNLWPECHCTLSFRLRLTRH